MAREGFQNEKPTPGRASDPRPVLNLSDEAVYELLCKIDGGYRPTPEEGRALAERETLSLFGTRIIALPESLGRLANLQSLDLSDTQITALPESLGQLANLQSLDLSFTQITALPESLGRLANLQSLNLRDTQITALPESLGQLANLQSLNLNETQITALPEFVCRLTGLEILCLGGTGITELPDELSQLTKLKELYLWETKITRLPDWVRELSKLEMLSLHYSAITALPVWIGELPALRWLDLSGLTLPAIPESLAMRGLPFVDKEYLRSDERCVNLHGVTLTEQNKTVFLETPRLIPELYRKDALVPVRACKVIFLGDGGVGKSYTIRRFCAGGKRESTNNPYYTEETHGVEIGDYRVERGADSFDIRFWDFGGQEILHSMHRCFLTEESCYVVMVRTRETESTARARYWLKAVETAAPRSPVLLFVNCWGNAKGDRAVDAPRLKEEFPQIKNVVYCSAKLSGKEEFRRELMEPLTEMAAKSDMCGKSIPREWDQLIRAIQERQKNAIEKREQNYLNREEYLELCKAAKIGDEKTSDLLTLLNNLGVCFSYHREREGKQELSDYKLLNPIWLTNALYAIVEEGAAPAQAGIIKLDAIRTMLHNKPQAWFPKKDYRRVAPELVYEDEECQYILNVAERFRLCYRVDAEQIFFPALCGADTPKDALTAPAGYPQHVSYLLHYDYLPDSVLHQLMIRCMQSGIAVKPRWLKGMVLEIWNLHRACVRIAEEGKLRIDVYSKKPQPAYELFWMLRKEIGEINQRLLLSANEVILDGEDEFPLEAVLRAAEKGASMFGRGGEYSAEKLLGRYYERVAVQTMRVENKKIVISIPEREYHHCAKSNRALRHALYEAYNRICPYCGNPIDTFEEMEVDHILATNSQNMPELELYFNYLDSCKFKREKPDYIENYFPSHRRCNRKKSDRINEYSLPYWHDVAAQHAPKVMELMQKYQQQK